VYWKWPGAISLMGRLLTRTKRYCQSLTMINAGFVFDDQLRISADGGYRGFLTYGSITCIVLSTPMYKIAQKHFYLIMFSFASTTKYIICIHFVVSMCVITVFDTFNANALFMHFVVFTFNWKTIVCYQKNKTIYNDE
jgi:hypothetical protein